jgi:hypothetical protein
MRAYTALISKGENAIDLPDQIRGSWHLGQGRHPAALEEEALRTGISLGMTFWQRSCVMHYPPRGMALRSL